MQRPGSEPRLTPHLRWRAWALWAVGILAATGMITHQVLRDRAETAARQARHASLLAHDVWDFDVENAAHAARVIAEAEHYTHISIDLPDGQSFVRHDAPEQASDWPLAEQETATPIRRDGERLATLHTRGSDVHVVYYGLEAVALLLAGLLLQLVAQNQAHRRELEQLRLHDEITLREEVEARLAQREDELRRAQRLEALGQVAGGVAHDFNNLLTVIIGRIELAKRLASEAGAHLDTALEAADRAQAMTHRLLAFESGNAPRPSDLDVGELVRGMLDMLRPLLPSSVELETALDSAPVRADRGQLEQVILNLVVNARDALGAGGTIHIGTGQRADPSGQLRTVLVIRDDGVGMTQEVKRRVFEPFFTTKGSGGGTGLGLSTVAHIAEQSHAELELDSAPGQGTTVTVTFGSAQRTAAEPASAASPRKARVLVVEDDPDVRLFVRDALEGCGVEVTTARDPQDALRMLKLAPTGVDLVLSDAALPSMSGPVLREQARQWRVNVPFVFMSSNGADDGIDARDVLHKPFTPADLRGAVQLRLQARAS
jgi:two-component system cell cycle sensor histidine kinase/response regulator CckA